jgi:hypothetical protein
LGVNPLEAVVLVAVLALPLHALVLWQIGRLQDPAYLRQHGVVIVHEQALEAHSPAIGEYQGRRIWGTVTFKGMVYRFSRVTSPRNRERIGPHELYLEPGLVYVTD